MLIVPGAIEFVVVCCCGVEAGQVIRLAYVIVEVLYLVLACKYGMMDLAGVGPTGPYKVGYTDEFTTNKGNFCAVYYPASQSARLLTTKHGYIEGYGSRKALRKTMAWISPHKRPPPDFILKSLDGIEIPLAINANAAEGLPAKLPVLIFSHGLTAQAKGYSVFCRELASYGIVVIALDHMDGSCGYTVNQNNEVNMGFDDRHIFGAEPARTDQLEVRKAEVIGVIDKLSEGDFIVPGIEVDLDKIIVAGHSFGAITAIHSSLSEYRIAGVISLDPWFFPVHKQVEKRRYK